MSKSSCSVNGTHISCDPGNPEFYNNPYPAYDEMRGVGPCFFWEEYQIWCFAHHDLVNVILRDRRFGRQMPNIDLVAAAKPHLKDFYRFEANSMLELEPPDHTRLRKLVNRAFVSRKIETLRPQIEQLAHKLIDEFPQQKPVDLLQNYAQIIPVRVIAQMLGVPAEMSNQLLSWSHAMVAMYQHNRSRQIEDEAVLATREFSKYIADIVRLRRKQKKDDLISHMIAQQENGGELSDDELITSCILLLNAGHEATVHAIGNGVKALLELKDKGMHLVSEKQTIANLCEELIRFDPPLHKFTRFVLEDLEIGGRDFKRGESVGLLLGAANRDGKRFENPNQIIADRPALAAANTAFGAGIHFCIGAPLARMEMQIALPILFERLPGIHLAKPPQYADRYHFHGLEELQIAW